MSIEKIKRELRDDVKKNVMVQKLQEKNFTGIEASRREVEDFYYKYKDSIGVIPDKVKLSHIYRNPKSSNEQKQKFYDITKAILDSINHGADFSIMAKRYSQDPASAANGGILGLLNGEYFTPNLNQQHLHLISVKSQILLNHRPAIISYNFLKKEARLFIPGIY